MVVGSGDLHENVRACRQGRPETAHLIHTGRWSATSERCRIEINVTTNRKVFAIPSCRVNQWKGSKEASAPAKCSTARGDPALARRLDGLGGAGEVRWTVECLRVCLRVCLRKQTVESGRCRVPGACAEPELTSRRSLRGVHEHDAIPKRPDCGIDWSVVVLGRKAR